MKPKRPPSPPTARSESRLVVAVPFPLTIAESPTATGSDDKLPVEFDFDGYYDLLGVGRDATTKEIERADAQQNRRFDKLARRGDSAATDRIRQLREARAVLTDATKRDEYDRSAEARFLSIQDPVQTDRVGLEDGLALIEQLTMDPRDPDPMSPPDRAQGRDIPNQLLDNLLK